MNIFNHSPQHRNLVFKSFNYSSKFCSLLLFYFGSRKLGHKTNFSYKYFRIVVSVLPWLILPIVTHGQNPYVIINSLESSKKLGSGVDLDNINKPMGSPIDHFDTVHTKLAVSGESKLYLVENEENVREALGINAGISVRNLSYSAAATFGLQRSSSVKSNSVHLLLKCEEYYDQFDINPSSVRFSAIAKRAIVNKRFNDLYGKYYVSSLRQGSMILVEILITANNNALANELLSSVSGNVNSGFLSGSASSNLSQTLNDNSAHLSIELHAHYLGLKSNAGIQQIISGFKNGAVGYNLDTLGKQIAAQLKEMDKNEAYPVKLFVSPWDQLDPDLSNQTVDLSNMAKNDILKTLVNQYFLVENKATNIDNLLEMRDPNYVAFFHHPNIDPVSNASFDTVKFSKYQGYKRKLSGILKTIQIAHSCNLKGNENCPTVNTPYLGDIIIPEIHHGIFYWTSSDPKKIYVFNSAVVDEVLSNLTPNAKVQLTVHLNIISQQPCTGAQNGGYVFVWNSIGTGGQQSETVLGLYQSYLYDRTFDNSIDKDGKLNFRFGVGINYCYSGVNPLTLGSDSYISVDYAKSH